MQAAPQERHLHPSLGDAPTLHALARPTPPAAGLFTPRSDSLSQGPPCNGGRVFHRRLHQRTPGSEGSHTVRTCRVQTTKSIAVGIGGGGLRNQNIFTHDSPHLAITEGSGYYSATKFDHALSRRVVRYSPEPALILGFRWRGRRFGMHGVMCISRK